jgi:hypothetical protein
MDLAYGMHEKEEKSMQGFNGETLRVETTWKT